MRPPTLTKPSNSVDHRVDDLGDIRDAEGQAAGAVNADEIGFGDLVAGAVDAGILVHDDGDAGIAAHWRSIRYAVDAAHGALGAQFRDDGVEVFQVPDRRDRW